MELPIIYEDDGIVVIDKPVSIMVHPDGRSTEETVCDWFVAHCPESKTVGEVQLLTNGEALFRPGIVHRLDRETSGVLVLAKTKETHTWLKHAFANRLVKKTYLAFVYGVPKVKKGTIIFSIGRSRKDFRLRSAQPKAKGTLRDAITKYEVIGETKTHSLLKVMPETGRTHQIRVHLKAIHHPIVGDPLYAPNHPSDLGFFRLGLHASELVLPATPEDGTMMYHSAARTLSSPLPEDLKKAQDLFLVARDTVL